jgi:TPR repeat protein
MEAIGSMYSNGEGYPQNYAIAFQYYDQAVNAGDLDAKASLGLATIHGWGEASR